MGERTDPSRGRFDDGSHDIPEGMAGSVRRVLVVGAGIAGLDRRERAPPCGRGVRGPRGSPAGGWSGCTPSTCRARRWISVAPGCTTPRATRCGASPGRQASSTGPAIRCLTSRRSISRPAGGCLRRSSRRARPASSRASPPRSVACATSWRRTPRRPTASRRTWHRRASQGDELRRARQGLRAFVEADASGAAEQQSLQWLWTQDEYDDDYFGDLPRHGYRTVVDAMASGLDVRLGWPAARVELTDEGVSVSSDLGETEHGSHAVVAVPLGVLQERSARPSHRPLPRRTVRTSSPAWASGGTRRSCSRSPGPSRARPAGRTWCSSRLTPPSPPPGSSTSTRSSWVRSSPATCSTRRRARSRRPRRASRSGG